MYGPGYGAPCYDHHHDKKEYKKWKKAQKHSGKMSHLIAAALAPRPMVYQSAPLIYQQPGQSINQSYGMPPVVVQQPQYISPAAAQYRASPQPVYQQAYQQPPQSYQQPPQSYQNNPSHQQNPPFQQPQPYQQVPLPAPAPGYSAGPSNAQQYYQQAGPATDYGGPPPYAQQPQTAPPAGYPYY